MTIKSIRREDPEQPSIEGKTIHPLPRSTSVECQTFFDCESPTLRPVKRQVSCHLVGQRKSHIHIRKSLLHYRSPYDD